jgi:hypothetical protein
MPKYGWLFHVAFDLNPEIARLPNDELLKVGLTVKSASLPKFTVDTKTLNAYNRIDIVQTKVKYDPVTIKFHDDNLDIVRKFWYDYYSYYYRDSDWNENIYSSAFKYSERQNQIWGYTPRQYPASVANTNQFISAIRIYSLHNKKFAEYTLLNPTITNFQHGEHAQGGDAGTLENSMTVQFQAVKYQYGQVSEDTVTGFATLEYDKRPSTLGTTNVTDTKIHDMAEGLTGLGGILNNLKNLNGKAIAGAALSAAGSALLTKGIDAAASGIASGVAAGKAAYKKAFSNGGSIDGVDPGGAYDGLPSDSAGAGADPQARVDQATAQLSADEDALAQANADLEAGEAERAQLEAQIESDTYTLEYDPNLSEEDIAALQQIIDDNKAKLDSVISNNSDLQDNIDALTTQVLDDQYALQEAQDALNASGNSEEDGGPGADSVTTTDGETGRTTTTNPDGSSTSYDEFGTPTTVPQQNAVDNPNASSNQKVPVFKLSETSNPSNYRA